MKAGVSAESHPLPRWTTNDTGLERRDDTLAFPSEEQRDPGQYLLDSS